MKIPYLKNQGESLPLPEELVNVHIYIDLYILEDILNIEMLFLNELA